MNNYVDSVEDIRRKNKIRTKYKSQRMRSVTPAQKKLFEALKALGRVKQFNVVKEREIYTKTGVRFADIYIRRYGLAIEVDGDYHTTPEQKVADEMREKEIWAKKRVMTVRVSNLEVLENIDAVVQRISVLIDQLELLPNWKSPGRGKRLATTQARKRLKRDWQ